MPTLIFSLFNPMCYFERGSSTLVRKSHFRAHLDGIEVVVADPGGEQRPATAVVYFIESESREAHTGTLKYEYCWRDEKESIDYPGSLSLYLQVPEEVMAFLDRSPKEFASGAALMLSVEVDPLRKTIKHLPHEEHWDLAEGDRTDASITSLTYRYPQGPAGAA